MPEIAHPVLDHTNNTRVSRSKFVLRNHWTTIAAHGDDRSTLAVPSLLFVCKYGWFQIAGSRVLGDPDSPTKNLSDIVVSFLLCKLHYGHRWQGQTVHERIGVQFLHHGPHTNQGDELHMSWIKSHAGSIDLIRRPRPSSSRLSIS